MSTLERTKLMLEPLTEEQLIIIQEMTKRLISRKIIDNPYKPMSEQDFIDALAVARKHADQGKARDAFTVSAELREKYGL